jgi:hypothetical protein
MPFGTAKFTGTAAAGRKRKLRVLRAARRTIWHRLEIGDPPAKPASLTPRQPRGELIWVDMVSN